MNVQPQLIALCIKQDRKAEYELYKISYSFLLSICVRYTRDLDTAKENLNLGYLKILRNLEAYSPDVPFHMWMRKLMINTLIDEYRRNKIERETITYVDNYYDNNDFSDVNEALSRMSYQQILDEINKLPEATRKVFNLFAIDGFSHKEIAEILDISEGTSKWHLSEARLKLKESIELKLFVRV